MNETLLISEARELFAKKNGRLIHIHTIRRWIAKGIRKDGRIVRLQSEREGKRIVTRPEWVEQFKQELSDNRTEPSEVTQRRSGHAAAKRYLISEGVYGCKTSEQVSGRRVRSTRGNSRLMSQVLSGSASRDADGSGNGGRVDSGQVAQAATHDAAERLPLTTRATTSKT